MSEDLTFGIIESTDVPHEMQFLQLLELRKQTHIHEPLIFSIFPDGVKVNADDLRVRGTTMNTFPPATIIEESGSMRILVRIVSVALDRSPVHAWLNPMLQQMIIIVIINKNNMAVISIADSRSREHRR
ncbi:hypothetical protein F3Y22_tig00110654pilonHSYRG00014 [Hibiscus syriacus]|uniref:Uncharacterized protein n=1 Tax=Hibiscus syriacus TaxID=106335 RepID=A0A6A2ZXD6_HIBSY|nr:hypothetical protein F3Y22_tig00110654pilonHSYRG00014 [Hibiscus syriacus]